MQDIENDIKMYENMQIEQWGNHENVKQKRRELLLKIDVISRNSFDEGSRIEFIQTHQVVLYKIYDVFLGTTAKLYNKSSDIQEYRGSIDKLFNTLNIKPKSYFNYLPTRIFNQFVRGITYFDDENPTENPVYHRDASCKSSSMNIDAKFSKPSSKELLKKCYIERKIYNVLYQHFLHEQEVRHLKELYLVERYFQQYFPNISINVSIMYEDNYYPYKCVIITLDNDKVISTETYTKKPWNRETVLCEKQNIKNGRSTFFSKINSYQSNNSWGEVKYRKSN